MAAKKKKQTNGHAEKNGSGELHTDIRKLLQEGGVLHTRVYSRELPTSITAEEAEKFAGELAETVRERKIAEGDRREAMTEFRERLTGIKERQERLADSVQNHTRLDAVEVVEVLLASNEIDVRRLDTGASVEVRPASKEDLQQALPGVDEDDDADEEDAATPAP